MPPGVVWIGVINPEASADTKITLAANSRSDERELIPTER
jgi:hypothetical protein